MINLKKLGKMARKWRKASAITRKRISFQKDNGDVHASTGTISSSVADKGHFVVYTADQRRFVLPIVYLNTEIFRELLRLSEEEFGLPSDGPIMLPFDAAFMDYVVSVVQRPRAATEIQKALLVSIEYGRCSMSSSIDQEKQCHLHLLVSSF